MKIRRSTDGHRRLALAAVSGLLMLAACDFDDNPTANTPSVSSTATDDESALTSQPGALDSQASGSSPTIPTTTLTVEPDELCLQPGSVGNLDLTNTSDQAQQYTVVNALIFGDGGREMYSLRAYPGQPTIEGPFDRSTPTTVLPIAPSQLAPGESVQLGVRAPDRAGNYHVQLGTWTQPPASLALIVDPNCPSAP